MRRWTKKEDDIIYNKYAFTTSQDMILLLPNRSKGAILMRASKLGIEKDEKAWKESLSISGKDKKHSNRKHNTWSLDNFNDGYISQGRFMVYLPSHQRARKPDGYVLRSIAAYESYHNKSPSSNKEYEIHHIDQNTLNDSKENLICLSRSEHKKVHGRLNGSYVKRICHHCQKVFEIGRWKINAGEGKYCSWWCYHKHRFTYSGYRE